MATISEKLKDAIDAELQNNPEKYTGTKQENAERAAKQVSLDNPEAFQSMNPVDMMMFKMLNFD